MLLFATVERPCEFKKHPFHIGRSKGFASASKAYIFMDSSCIANLAHYFKGQLTTVAVSTSARWLLGPTGTALLTLVRSAVSVSCLDALSLQTYRKAETTQFQRLLKETCGASPCHLSNGLGGCVR